MPITKPSAPNAVTLRPKPCCMTNGLTSCSVTVVAKPSPPTQAGQKSRPPQDGEVGSRHRRARPAIAPRLQRQRRHQRQNGQTGGAHQDEAHLPVRILAEQAADKLTAAQRGDKSDGEHRQTPRQFVAAPVIPHDDTRNDRRATGTYTLQRAQPAAGCRCCTAPTARCSQ